MLNGRQKDILDILYRSGRVSVTNLAESLYVSEMTVRRDLAEMEKGGYLKRYRGGAVLKVDTREMPISERFYVDEDEKKKLCALAASYLDNNMTVYLDSSSTCLYIIPHIAKYDKILLVTNSVKALQSASALHIPCILLGGEYYAQDMCLVGPMTEAHVEEMNFDVAFMTTAAYSDDGVISDFDVRQTSVRKKVIKNAKKKVFLFERGKLGKKLTYTLCTRDEVNEIFILDK